MISQFNDIAPSVAETSSFSGIQGCVVGIDASEYLNRMEEYVYPPLALGVAGVLPEPLLSALGGVPFGLGRIVRAHIDIWRKYNITPFFVFNGLEVGTRNLDGIFSAAEVTKGKLIDAWRRYDGGNGSAAVAGFKAANAFNPRDLYRYLQQVLQSAGVEFMVAPYLAWPQLAYMAQIGTFDIVFAASEVLLFDVPEVVTKWNFPEETLVWVRRRQFIAALGNPSMSNEQFVDLCMMAGNELCPPIPQLDAGQFRKEGRLKSAVELVANSGGGSAYKAVVSLDEKPDSSDSYAEVYRKARMVVKHHIVMTKDGKVEPLHKEEAPFDIHDFIGKRLPDELYFYLTRGVISPRVLNWRTTDEIIEIPPLDGGETTQYRTLVGEQLVILRAESIAVLAKCLNFYYQRQSVTLRCWFEKEKTRTINMKEDFDPADIAPIIESWNVPVSVFGAEFNKHHGSTFLGICVKSLKNKEFAAQSITKTGDPLMSKDEILANSIWRMLHIRGYVDEGHNLTGWGEMLYAMVSALPQESQDIALIIVELAKLDLLNGKASRKYPGVPSTRAALLPHVMLISRIASFGELEHQQIGYTGILGRNLLVFNSIVEEMRKALRDLLEVCLTGLLLSGHASRDRKDWTDLSFHLPLVLPMSCCLGVKIAFHLTELVKLRDPKDREEVENLLKEAQDRCTYAINVPNSFERAWRIWDGVYQGIQAAPATFKEKEAFEQANAWLQTCR